MATATNKTPSSKPGKALQGNGTVQTEGDEPKSILAFLKQGPAEDDQDYREEMANWLLKFSSAVLFDEGRKVTRDQFDALKSACADVFNGTYQAPERTVKTKRAGSKSKGDKKTPGEGVTLTDEQKKVLHAAKDEVGRDPMDRAPAVLTKVLASIGDAGISTGKGAHPKDHAKLAAKVAKVLADWKDQL